MGEAKRKLEEKKVAFALQPDMFIDKRKLVFAAAMLDDDTVGIIMSTKSEAHYGAGLIKLQRKAYNVFNNIEMAKMAKDQNIRIPENPSDIIGDQK